jgi:LysR family glycine cleavage system transcriptional activator
VRPLVESGRLRYLTSERLKAEWSHWLVWPPRADDHAGLVAFREWVVEEAREHVATLQATNP